MEKVRVSAKHSGSPNETVQNTAVIALENLAQVGDYMEREAIQEALAILRASIFDLTFERSYLMALELDKILLEYLEG